MAHLKGLKLSILDASGANLTSLSKLETIAFTGSETEGTGPLHLPSSLRHLHFSRHVHSINYCSLIYLQSITLVSCKDLTEFVVDLPRTLKSLSITSCQNLKLLILKSTVKEVYIRNAFFSSDTVNRECTIQMKVGVECPKRIDAHGLIYVSFQFTK